MGGIEAPTGELRLAAGGEQDKLGGAQDPVFGEEPVDPFFEVFEGEGAAEVGIEHAVGKDHVGGCGR